MKPRNRAVAVRTVLAALVTGLALVATPALAADDELPPPVRVGGDVELEVTVPDVGQTGSTDAGTISDAELRWGLNAESGRASFYGGCNFLMAGVPGTDGDTDGSRVWGEADSGLYRAAQGAVEIRVPTADRTGERRATFADRCTDPEGDRITTGAENFTEAEVVIDGGTGERSDDGSVEIAWDGTFTVVYYGGLTYWWASDPRLELDANGDGALTATVGGFGSSMADPTKWVPLTERTVHLADVRGGRLDTDLDADGVADGGTLRPEYCEVRIDAPGTVQVRSDVGDTCWGSFPADFVAFQVATGQSSYWYTSGGVADRFKRASPITVSFDAGTSLGRTDDGGTSTGSGGTVTNPFVPQDPVSPDDTSGSIGAGSTAGRSLGAPVVAAVPAAGDAPVVFPAVAAATLGLDSDGLVPALTDDGGLAPGELLPWGVAVLALVAAAAVVGFRRGWLVLPFT